MTKKEKNKLRKLELFVRSRGRCGTNLDFKFPCEMGAICDQCKENWKNLQDIFYSEEEQEMTKSYYIEWLVSAKGWKRAEAEEFANLLYDEEDDE